MQPIEERENNRLTDRHTVNEILCEAERERERERERVKYG